MTDTRRIALEHRIYELSRAESGWVAVELLEEINRTPDKDRIYLLDLMVRNYLEQGSPVPDQFGLGRSARIS